MIQTTLKSMSGILFKLDTALNECKITGVFVLALLLVCHKQVMYPIRASISHLFLFVSGVWSANTKQRLFWCWNEVFATLSDNYIHNPMEVTP